ncbi:MAG: class I SAM-dependent methyltransferase [Anaerolineales bacterium]|jgi:ubiquinone/menaquinone biosynthesis C-methylase UbiE
MLWLLLVLLALLIALLVWEIWICEGVHLGRRFVVFLYDLAATRYEQIKEFDPDWEKRFLGEPVVGTLRSLQDAKILDVGAGTGRLARRVLPLGSFQGSIVCLDASRRMIAQGRQLTDDHRACWMQAWSVPLPFPDGVFDMVVSLEMLEFTPQPLETLAEMVRVTQPGGWVVVTNRVGWEAPWIVGHTYPSSDFAGVLKRLGLDYVEILHWQLDYDLAWARKAYL